jgi:hypothetical protein
MPHQERKTSGSRTRRDFLQALVVAGCTPTFLAQAEQTTVPPARTGSDVGSLFPFLERHARGNAFPLSFLNSRFRSVTSWRKRARTKVLDLLSYTSAKCEPNAQVTEKHDCGDYVRETVWFNTAPEVRVPAFILVPKRPKPMPAIVAFHDHGGFYFWGREKIVELEDEHPALTRFKKASYEGRSFASQPCHREPPE